MIICPNCNKQLEDGVRFCDGCGSPVQAAPAPQPQPAWEAPAPQPAPQAAWEAPVQPPQYQEYVPTPQEPAKEKKPINKKFLMIGAIAVAAVALIILVISLFGGSKHPDYALYVKDGELQFSKLSGKAKEMTNDYSSKNTNVGATLSQDGKKLFYFDKEEGYLYVRDVSGSKDPVKIDEGVTEYVVNDAANLVTYIKQDGTESILCQHDLKERKKISSDNVTDFVVTRDGKKIVFLTADGDLYPVTKKEKGEKISSEVDSIEKVNKDLSKIYYTKNDSLYLKNGKKNDKIAKDVYDIVNIYDSGEFYYISHVNEESEDNVSTGFVTDEEGNIDIDKTVENYAKSNGFVGYTLHYNDGKNDTKIGDVVKDYYHGSAEDKPVMIYATIDVSAATKDINAENIYEKLGEMYKERKYYVLIEDKSLEISDSADISNVNLSSDGKTLYYIKDISDEKYIGQLCEVEVSKKLGKEKTIDEDVYGAYISRTKSGNYIYYKDVDQEKNEGELFVDKKSIDQDVYLGYRTFIPDSKLLVYFVDYSKEKSEGTLKSATLKGKVNKIAEDVYDYEIALNGQILYLYDYNTENSRGELYISTNGKQGKKLDEDVRTILSFYSNTDYNNYRLGYEID